MKTRMSPLHLSLLLASLATSTFAAVAADPRAAAVGPPANPKPASSSPLPSKPTSNASNFSTSSATSSATSPVRSYVHFDCGTHLGTADDHFINTVQGLHNGTYGGQYNASSVNGISRLRRSLNYLLGRQTNAGSAASASQSTTTGNTPAPVGRVNVGVYIHVVTTAAHKGMITDDQVKKQVAALNNAYNPNAVFFTLKGSDFTTNDAWAVGGSDSLDFAMKQALRKGTYSDLNLYFQSDLAGGVLGQCTLPTNVGSNPSPSVYVRDGCNIAAGTVPGGPINGYNMGKTAVHETGHWLGLLHTFEGYSCSGKGDFVDDTPSESQSTDGCPQNPWKNTCAGRPGQDPIHNYMDYSTDACYTRFTPGQKQRIMSLWPAYRAGK